MQEECKIYNVTVYCYRSFYFLVLWEHAGFQHINAEIGALFQGCVCHIISLSKPICLRQFLLGDIGDKQGKFEHFFTPSFIFHCSREIRHSILDLHIHFTMSLVGVLFRRQY